nr:6264_t:CDS:2 [Entrophospora candida]
MKSLKQQPPSYCYSSILLYYLICISSIISLVSSQCYDVTNPFDNKLGIFSSCATVKDDKNSLLLDSTDVNNTSADDKSNMIKILFNCGDNNDPKHCEKAKLAFEEAATFITSTIDLQVPITLNASFFNICGVMVVCEPNKPLLGAAAPSRYIPLLDDDDVVRLYPQALAKQFKFDTHLEYMPIDIVTGFNSAIDIFWFKGDPPIRDDQVDFVLVVTHEMLHGLGFLSSWNDYYTLDVVKGLTPFPSFLMKDFEEIKGEVTFTGFQENCFDRRLQLASNNEPLYNTVLKLNTFAGGVENKTKFSSYDDFANQFTNSSIFQEYAVGILNTSTTPDTILFKAHDDDEDKIFIETTFSPFKPGSSMSHLDNITNNHTVDFVMMWKAARGVTVANITAANGGNTTYTNLLGPRAIRVLETLGYQTATYRTPYRPKAAVVSDDNNNTTSS